jgi:AcrR family transcriptional regulator
MKRVIKPAAPPPADPRSTETRQRLIDAAGEVFSVKGFRDVTIREICRQAHVNIAAVNYHFRSKEGLYATVLEHAHALSNQKYRADFYSSQDLPPSEQLRRFVRAFLLRMFDEGKPSWFGKLVAREMMEPTRALDDIVREYFAPLARRLQSILAALLGPAAVPEVVFLCMKSVIGQCVFYRHARPVLERLDPRQGYAKEDIERLAEHVTAFSLGGIRHYATGVGRASR